MATLIKFSVLVFTALPSRTVHPGRSSHHLLGLVRAWHLWSSLRGRLYFESDGSMMYPLGHNRSLQPAYSMIDAVCETSLGHMTGELSSSATHDWTCGMQNALSFSSDYFIQLNVHMYNPVVLRRVYTGRSTENDIWLPLRFCQNNIENA